MAAEIDVKDLYRWMGTIDANVESIKETINNLASNYKNSEKETRTHRETVEARLSAGNIKFESYEKRIEKVELKNGIRNNSTFISWKWIVEKLWQPVLIAIVVFAITELAK